MKLIELVKGSIFQIVFYRRLALSVAAAGLMLLLIVHRAYDLDLVADRVSHRVSLMVFPVCVSALYHGHRHDFTAFQELRTIANHYTYTVAGGKESSPKVAPMLPLMVNAKISNPDATMYWGYDDRGLADYCVAAFSVFGPEISSMSKLWLLLLTASAAGFVMFFWRAPTGPPILFMFLACAYLGLGLYSFMQIPASLSEERALEFLSYLPALHLALVPWTIRLYDRSSLDKLAVAAVAFQVAIFVFLYHCRSSIGWQILPVLGSSLAALVWRTRSVRSRVSIQEQHNAPLRKMVTLLFPVIALAVGLLLLSGYTRLTYNPAYFGEEGGRNFYHNALMGLHGMSYPGEPKLEIDDGLIFRSVKSFTAKERGVEEAEVKYVPSFGKAYETDARRYYLYLLSKDPWGTLKYYLSSKMYSSLAHLWARSFLLDRNYGTVRVGEEMRNMGEPGVMEYVRWKNLLFSPLMTPLSILTVIFSVLFARGSTVGVGPSIVVASMFLLAGLIPSVAFYIQDMKQLTGAMLSIGLIVHLVAYWLLAFLWRRYGYNAITVIS